MARTATAPGVPTTRLGKAAVEFDDRLIVAGPLRRTLPAELPPGCRLPDGFSDPRVVMPGILAIRGPAYRDEVHLLRVNVARLRRKIEDVASQPRYVLTHARAGYSVAVVEND